VECEGRAAAFYITIPNMNHVLKILRGTFWNPIRDIRALLAWRKIKDCRNIMLGVLPEFRGRGIEMILIQKFIDDGISIGWEKAEVSWILEDNKDILNVIKEFDCVPTRRYRIYGMDI
jgi:GNAT superfamily N-acetyltransferase